MQVDDGSALMEQIARRVEAERSASPALGITAELDQWRSDERAADGLPAGERRHRDWYVKAGDRAVLEQYLARIARDTPSLAVPADHQFVFAHVETGWRSYYALRKPVFTDRFIVAAKAIDLHGHPYVSAELTPEGAKQWAAATRASAGRKLAILVDGVVNSAPIVESEVERFLIPLPEAEAPALADKLRCQ